MDITTATPQELKREYDRIALEMNDDRFFTTKELQLLPKIMSSDEWLYGFSSGFMDNSTWLIVLTSKRVIFLNKNLLFGHEETSIGLGKINSVQKKTGIMFGTMMLHDGSREYAIRNVWKKSVIPFTNRLNKAIEDFERSMRTGIPIPAPDAAPADAVPAPAPAPVEAPAQSPPVAPPEPPIRSIEMPPAPVSGPLRAYLDSVPDPTRATSPGQPSPPSPPPVANAVKDDPVALRARLDRLRAAGAIDDAEHARRMQDVAR